MEETTPDILENAPENVENEPEEPVQAEPQPEPKKRGRPAGAKDKAPRKKIKIVAEPLAPPEEPVPSEASEEPAQPSQSSAPEPVPEPPSPRTLHRQAAELILHLNNQRSEARRAQMRDMYTKNLAIY
jgi:hypothetical protein